MTTKNKTDNLVRFVYFLVSLTAVVFGYKLLLTDPSISLLFRISFAFIGPIGYALWLYYLLPEDNSEKKDPTPREVRLSFYLFASILILTVLNMYVVGVVMGKSVIETVVPYFLISLLMSLSFLNHIKLRDVKMSGGLNGGAIGIFIFVVFLM